MPVYSAHDAVGLAAEFAFELLIFLVSIPFKYKLAIRSRAVVEHLIVLFKEEFELEFLNFIIKLSITEGLYFYICQLNSSLWFRA